MQSLLLPVNQMLPCAILSMENNSKLGYFCLFTTSNQSSPDPVAIHMCNYNGRTFNNLYKPADFTTCELSNQTILDRRLFKMAHTEQTEEKKQTIDRLK